jgi:FG-GAP-like repeat
MSCGFGSSGTGGNTGAAGSTVTGSAGVSGATGNGVGTAGTGAGTPGTAGSGTTTGTAGTGTAGTGTASTGTAGSGTTTGTAGTGTTTGAAGAGVVTPGGFKNYELTGAFPNAPVAIAQKPGTLKYTKFVVHTQFLAESCSIADYNGDGIPDVSSGRMWYQGTGNPATPISSTGHPFRSGHGALPIFGDGPEINTGVSDDWADFPWDVDGDGNTDIINVAQCDVNEIQYTSPKIGTVQVHATAVWYKNPGPAALGGDPMWVSHLMHSDVRLEQHGLVDINGDGFPEIYGACKGCNPATTKGYYQGDPKNPTAPWTFHSVTVPYTFPFGGTGWLHGEGGGDVNGDGLSDLLEKGGAWLQQPGGTWNSTPCTGKNTPAGCGWVKAGSPLLPMGFSSQGFTDGVGNVGPSNMYAVDMDKDGCSDVVAADWAHGVGLYWYQQQKDATGCTLAFKKYQFMGDSAKDSAADATKWGAGFTEPHALEVIDMDGDGRPDVIVGKMRFAHPHGYGDPDSDSPPYVYVFKNVATVDARTGGPITLEPHLVDGAEGQVAGSVAAGMGVGRHFSVGHVNTDGIMDICVGTKVGLAVYLGQ